jgi:hypothetical protein
MESADQVRASLAVVALPDLRDHEATTPDGEARVAALLARAGRLSWPLVVDADTGLILDGSHRARVLRRELGARFVPVQEVRLSAPEVRVRTWCRILEGVPPAAFDRARRALALEADRPGGFACRYAGRLYGRSGLDPVGAYMLAGELERLVTGNGHGPRLRVVEDEDAAAAPDAPDALVVHLPALDKDTVRRRATDGVLPPKSTRFLLPFRLIGLDLGLALLAGPREAVAAALDRERQRPVLCLGPDLGVDRRYPERLWQFDTYRIPDRLFADEVGRRAYASALARARQPASSGP